MKVYLYELDSVRNSAAEIQIAQERLFEETVGENKNTVVLSANQLLDGMGFTGALYGEKGEENYQTILKLFRSGLVKVCKFTNPATGETVETLSKYWMSNMGKKHFIVSGMELSSERKSDMKAVLTGEKNKDILDVWDDTGTKEEKADAQYVQRVVNLILELDYNVKNIWVDEEKGAVNVELSELLRCVIEAGKASSALTASQDIQENIQRALNALDEANSILMESDQGKSDKKNKPSNYRSNWYKELKTEGNGAVNVPAVIQTARYIIDLCYNLSIESGISGVHLPYEVNGLDENEIRNQQSRYVLEKVVDYLEPTVSALRFPPWEDALETIKEAGPGNKAFRKRMLFGLLYFIVLAGMYFIVFPRVDTLLELVNPNKLLSLVLSLAVSTFVDWIIAKIAKTKDNMLETLKKLFRLPYKKAQVNNYLQRMGWLSRHFKNFCTYCKKIKNP